MAYYGYIRVSTKGQVPGTSLAEQEQQIKERYPTAIIVKEAASGAHERQVFDNLCKSLQAGDTLVVCKMDRFCRSAKEGLQYVDLLRDKGVAVHILNMGLLDNSPMGRLVATMLLAFAEFERAQIIERTQSGRQAAMAKPGFRDTENKIIFDPTAADCIPYDVFASIDAAPDDTERQERLEQLAYLLLPDKANDSEAGVFFTKNGRKMITAALICYYGMGWGFIEICEFFLGHDWRSLLNDIAKQENTAANAYISSFAGASEQNTAGCKQSADDALKLFATNSKIKNALRKVPTYEKSICPATLEQNSIYIFIPDEKLKIYGDLLRIITAQSMEYFSSRPPEHKQMILFCLDEFASFGKLQITEALRKLRKRHIRIMVLTQSLADLDMIYGKDERKAMLGNFKFTVLLGCKDTETQEYFSKMIGEKHTLLVADTSQKPQPIIKPADLAHLEHDLIVICDDGAVRLHKNFYFK